MDTEDQVEDTTEAAVGKVATTSLSEEATVVVVAAEAEEVKRVKKVARESTLKATDTEVKAKFALLKPPRQPLLSE